MSRTGRSRPGRSRPGHSRPGRSRLGHSRLGRSVSWPPILPWLALLLAACQGTPAPETRPIPHPSLEAVEVAAREQIEEARDRVVDLEAEGPRGERSEAFGRLGRLYQGYGFDEAALAAYSKAAALATDEFRWV